MTRHPLVHFFFFFNDTATTEIYPLSLHDALPICPRRPHGRDQPAARRDRVRPLTLGGRRPAPARAALLREPEQGDRKSTRLNSSHVRISYAVFCLKKKKKKKECYWFAGSRITTRW